MALTRLLLQAVWHLVRNAFARELLAPLEEEFLMAHHPPACGIGGPVRRLRVPEDADADPGILLVPECAVAPETVLFLQFRQRLVLHRLLDGFPADRDPGIATQIHVHAITLPSGRPSAAG